MFSPKTLESFFFKRILFDLPPVKSSPTVPSPSSEENDQQNIKLLQLKQYPTCLYVLKLLLLDSKGCLGLASLFCVHVDLKSVLMIDRVYLSRQEDHCSRLPGVKDFKAILNFFVSRTLLRWLHIAFLSKNCPSPSHYYLLLMQFLRH